MNNIRYVAWYTFVELVRNKVLYAIVFFAFFIFATGIAITHMTIGNEKDIIADAGFATIEIFCTVFAIFSGVSIVQRELVQKTLFPLFARPLSRAQYIIGKFFGLSFLIFILTVFMSIIFFALVLWYGDGGRILHFMPGIFTIYLQTCMVIAVAVFCSCFAEPVVAAMFTISYYAVGATSYNLVYLLQGDITAGGVQLPGSNNPVFVNAVNILRYILPDFSTLNIKNTLVYGKGLEGVHLGSAVLYGFATIIIVVSLAVFFFNRKEIN